MRILDDMSIVEVFTVYDSQPLLFSCRAPQDEWTLWLAVAAGDTGPLVSQWLYVNLSLGRFAALQDKKIDLLTAFNETESKTSLWVYVPEVEEIPLGVTVARTPLPPSLLPLAGIYLS